MVQRHCENRVIFCKPLKNTKIKIGSVIRETLCSEHKTSYRTCLGEFTEFILEVSLTEMSLQRLIFQLPANVRQTFLVFLLHFNRKLFSSWISLHYHPVDLLHCSSPAQQLQLLPSPHLPAPTQHHQSNTTNPAPRELCLVPFNLLIRKVYFLHQKRFTEVTFFSVLLMSIHAV